MLEFADVGPEVHEGLLEAELIITKLFDEFVFIFLGICNCKQAGTGTGSARSFQPII